MQWQEHPRVKHERARTIKALKHNSYAFRRLKSVVFLCGGLASTRRDDLRAYLDGRVPDVLTFYAEAVWAVISAAVSPHNALELEARLAELADVCIIIVESPGTFAELGAFAMSEPLRRKLLPLLDLKHRGAASFLVTGPVRWIDADSQFQPSIWTDLDRLLGVIGDIEERLKRLGKARPTQVTDPTKSPKHLLFLVCDLVAVFGPCPSTDVSDVLTALLDIPVSSSDVNFYVALGRAMGLLGGFHFKGEDVFYRRITNDTFVAFQRKRRIDLLTLRAQMLSAMQSCGLCNELLSEYAKHS
jgi:hypothetical protein